jgi:hypothetical protein
MNDFLRGTKIHLFVAYPNFKATQIEKKIYIFVYNNLFFRFLNKKSLKKSGFS